MFGILLLIVKIGSAIICYVASDTTDKKKRTKCRRVSVPLRLRLFSDQLRRKAEQCLEAQARAADLQLTREIEAFFGATDESAPAAGNTEEEVDADSEGGVDVVWGHNGREQEQ